ncbi:S41 family peptidase [Aliiglaciecola sp.]|nr:S41 family peptidase [Aliiglaciecola sp.]
MQKFLACILFIPAILFAKDMDVHNKNKILTDLKQEISEQYVVEQNVPEILAALESLSSSGMLLTLAGEKEFAKAIDEKLKPFDKHFSFNWSDPNQPQDNNPSESYWDELKRKNSGFNKVEILEGNIGYIDFWGFDKVNNKSRQRVANVMSFVAETDAIIFDVRNNGGGHPEMVQLLISYLLDKRTHLNSIYWRHSNTTDEFWTFRRVKGKRLANIPVYILTSNDTFSAAEEFAYDLQSLNRAIVIGEATGGGAHPKRFIDFGRGFVAGIPYGKAINPITKTNWEWVGVTPDVIAQKDSAFNIGYKTALEKLLMTKIGIVQKTEIENKIRVLSAQTN